MLADGLCFDRDMTDAQLLPFGAAPVPSASADIESRVIRLLASLAQPGVSGLDSARVAAVLDGSDLASLRVEVTGLAVDDHRLSAAPLTPPTVDVAHREPATVRDLLITAHPASVLAVPVEIDVAASDLPFEWVVGSDGLLYVEVRPPTDATPVVGTARVAAARKDIAAAAETALAEILREKGFTLTAFDLRFRSTGPRALSVLADAKVKKGLLRAGVTVSASASIDRSLVLQVIDTKISGSNPVVDGLLAPFRSKISANAERKVDLAALLPAGVVVTDVSVTAGEEVVLSVALG